MEKFIVYANGQEEFRTSDPVLATNAARFMEVKGFQTKVEVEQ